MAFSCERERAKLNQLSAANAFTEIKQVRKMHQDDINAATDKRNSDVDPHFVANQRLVPQVSAPFFGKSSYQDKFINPVMVNEIFMKTPYDKPYQLKFTANSTYREHIS